MILCFNGYQSPIWITRFFYPKSHRCNSSMNSAWWSSNKPFCSQSRLLLAWKSYSCYLDTDLANNFSAAGPYPPVLCELLLSSPAKTDTQATSLPLCPISTVLSCSSLIFWFFDRLGNKSPYWLSLIHIWRCRRNSLCRSWWSPYH